MVGPDDVRELALALPATIERPSCGQSGFRVKDELFARLHQDGGSLVLWVEREEREMLAQIEPQKFFWTPHYEQYDWVQVRLATLDPVELAELLAGSWRRRAPGSLLPQLDPNPRSGSATARPRRAGLLGARSLRSRDERGDRS